MTAPRPPLPLWPLLAVLVVSVALLVLPSMAASRLGGGPIARIPAGVEASQTKACQGRSCTELVEMEVRDVVPLREAETHAVVLVTKDRALILPIFVDEGAAVAIAFRLAHRSSPHPQAQDLLDSMLTQLGGILTEVRIDNVQDAVFTGRVLISQGDKRLQLAARPSDSIAMALAHGVKIFASRKVLSSAGITQEEIDRLRALQKDLPLPDGEGPGVGGSGEDDGEPEVERRELRPPSEDDGTIRL